MFIPSKAKHATLVPVILMALIAAVCAVQTPANQPAAAAATSLPDARTLAMLAIAAAQHIDADEARAAALIGIARTQGQIGNLEDDRYIADLLQKEMDGIQPERLRAYMQAESDVILAGAFAAAKDHKTYRELMGKYLELKDKFQLPVPLIYVEEAYIQAGEHDKFMALLDKNPSNLSLVQQAVRKLAGSNGDAIRELIKRSDDIADQAKATRADAVHRAFAAGIHADAGDLEGTLAFLHDIPIAKRPYWQQKIIGDLCEAGDRTMARKVYQDLAGQLADSTDHSFDYALFQLHIRFGETDAAFRTLDRMRDCTGLDADNKPIKPEDGYHCSPPGSWPECAALAAARLGKDDIAAQYRHAAIKLQAAKDPDTDDYTVELDCKVLEKHAEFLAGLGKVPEAMATAARVAGSHKVSPGAADLLETAIACDDLSTAIAALPAAAKAIAAMGDVESAGVVREIDIPRVAAMIVRQHNTKPIDARDWIDSFSDPRDRAVAAISLAEALLRQQEKATTRPATR